MQENENDVIQGCEFFQNNQIIESCNFMNR